MQAKQSKRQSIRRALILLTFLSFPLIFNYFSPYLIMESASKGVVNGSFLVFAGMLVSALVVGRLWCGWACPAGGLQEAATLVNNRPARTGRLDWIKWGIWIVWLGLIAAAAAAAGGYRSVDFFYSMPLKISVDDPTRFFMYYTVVLLILAVPLFAGRRAFCHYACWMAPFMIVGRSLRNVGRWHSLNLQPDTSRCKGCKECVKNCPMSLDVYGMVQAGSMRNRECILCGTCADGCPQKVIHFGFSREG